LSDLEHLGRPELVDQFTRLYGSPPPKYLFESILRLAIAYRLQEDIYGGLKPAIRKSLLSKTAAIRPSLSTGSVLIREWHGQTHVVTLNPDGIEYSGQRFRSLTEVAFRITGQKRSGPLFFGLKKGGKTLGASGHVD
jgi:hypothetical protein